MTDTRRQRAEEMWEMCFDITGGYHLEVINAMLALADAIAKLREGK